MDSTQKSAMDPFHSKSAMEACALFRKLCLWYHGTDYTDSDFYLISVINTTLVGYVYSHHINFPGCISSTLAELHDCRLSRKSKLP